QRSQSITRESWRSFEWGVTAAASSFGRRRSQQGPISYEYASGRGGHGTSANDQPESAFRVSPERRVEFCRRQIENGVVRLVRARDDERVQKAPNASGSPAALDVVERDVPEFYR